MSIKTALIDFIMRVHQLLMRVARGSDYAVAPINSALNVNSCMLPPPPWAVVSEMRNVVSEGVHVHGGVSVRAVGTTKMTRRCSGHHDRTVHHPPKNK